MNRDVVFVRGWQRKSVDQRRSAVGERRVGGQDEGRGAGRCEDGLLPSCGAVVNVTRDVAWLAHAVKESPKV